MCLVCGLMGASDLPPPHEAKYLEAEERDRHNVACLWHPCIRQHRPHDGGRRTEIAQGRASEGKYLK